jgi:uncharacterized RDD family membrane protein YckC
LIRRNCAHNPEGAGRTSARPFLICRSVRLTPPAPERAAPPRIRSCSGGHPSDNVLRNVAAIAVAARLCARPASDANLPWTEARQPGDIEHTVTDMSQPTDRVRIGFLMRFIVAIVDGLVAWALVLVPSIVLGAIIGPVTGSIAGGLLVLAYFALEIVKGQSVGKMVFNYTITAQDGSPATRDQLIKRYAYKYAPRILALVASFPFLSWVSFIGLAAALGVLIGTLMALKPEKLAFHDKLFKTAVFGPRDVTVSVPFLNKQLFTIPAPTAAPQTPPAPPAPQKIAA